MAEMDDPLDAYWHRCEDAVRWYEMGVAIVFYQLDDQHWYFAQVDRRVASAWSKGVTAVHPLASRSIHDYEVCIAVAYCPWCGQSLSEDRDFLDAERLYRRLREERACRGPARRPMAESGAPRGGRARRERRV